jgi:integrase
MGKNKKQRKGKKQRVYMNSKKGLLPHVPTKQKILKFVACCCNDTSMLVLFWIQCFFGLRIGSAIRLKWTDLDWDINKVFIKDDKNVNRGTQGDYGKDMIKPIPDIMVPILKMWQHMNKGEQYVIPRKDCRATEKNIIRLWEKRYDALYEKAGLKEEWVQMKDGRWRYKYNSHSGRHICGTNLALNRLPLQEIQKFLGHSKPEQTMVYVHIANELLRQSINEVYKPERQVFATKVTDLFKKEIHEAFDYAVVPQ